jgi:hydrogenase maturation protein HypF
MMLELVIGKTKTDETYELVFLAEGLLDWRPIIRDIISDMTRGMSIGKISAEFHNTLAKWIALEAVGSRIKNIVLSGGCFQNKYLLQKTIRSVRSAGLGPIFHRTVPTNDGGIALGQIAAAVRFLSFNK